MNYNRNHLFLRSVVEDGEGGGGDPPPGETPADPPADGGEGALGDAGKRALDAMKEERNAARRESREMKAQMEALQAQIDAQGKPAEEQAIEAARREARQEAMQAANDKVLRAEIRAQAAGKLADPKDALALLDLASFDVAEDGTIDTEAIQDALDDLVKTKPYLAPQRQGLGGSADGGTRNADPSGGKQLAREDLAGMSADDINKARSEGRLNRLLGISA